MSMREKIQGVLDQLPPIPGVAVRIMEIVADPEFSTDELVATASTDPVLTGKVLRLCNSSLYGLSREIRTPGEAVAYLGTRTLVNLAISTCVAAYYHGKSEGYFLQEGELWKHSVACGMACQKLAARARSPMRNVAFTAGVLHNIGKVAMAEFIPDQADKIRRSLAEAPRDFTLVEREVLGMDHAEAGGIVAENWNLPEIMTNAIKNHHSPPDIDKDGDLTALVHIADCISMDMGIGTGIDGLSYRFHKRALSILGLDTNDLSLVKIELVEEFAKNQDLIMMARTETAG